MKWFDTNVLHIQSKASVFNWYDRNLLRRSEKSGQETCTEHITSTRGIRRILMSINVHYGHIVTISFISHNLHVPLNITCV